MQSHRAFTLSGVIIMAGVCGALAPARSLGQAPAKGPLAPGSIFVVLTVRDSGTKLEREERTQRISIPQPGEEKRFERSVQARPGYFVADIKLGTPTHPAVSNLQAVVAGDRKVVRVLGEWSSAPEASPVIQSGSRGTGKADFDAAVPVTLVEEKATAVELPPQVVSDELRGQLVGDFGAGELSLPPEPSQLVRLKRCVDLEIRQADEGGRSYLLLSAPNVQFPCSAMFTRWGWCTTRFGAEQVGHKVRFTFGGAFFH
jgi:hypothetical protein